MRLPARIAAIRQETPTVKAFALDLQGREITFLPGQWVDCYAEIDGRMEAAGYSITSSPFKRESIELAVKLVGENPVTRYLHQQARVGDMLQVEGGQGRFFYTRDMGDEVALLDGGIGITPLMSILRYVDEVGQGARATLLYSARTPEELLFREQIKAMAQRNPNIRCMFTLTRPSGHDWHARVGRIDKAMILDAQVDIASALFYICGPPPMIRDMTALLREIGVRGSQIKYERW